MFKENSLVYSEYLHINNKTAAPFVLGIEYRHHVLASQQKIRKTQ